MDKYKEIADSILVERYLSGDNEALALLVEKWHKKYCVYAYKYVKDINVAKDVAQESWVSIINNIGNLKNPEKFANWSLCIVTRKALGVISGNKKSVKLEGYHVENRFAEEPVEGDKEKIKCAIMKLSVNQQVVLRLFYLENYKIHEIASMLKISVGTVKSRLFTARERLKLIIKK